jgi:protein SCO1/2
MEGTMEISEPNIVLPKNKRVLYCLMVLVALAGCGQAKQQLPYYNTPDFTPAWYDKNEAAEKEIHCIDSFRCIDQLGNTITEKELEAKITVVSFFFTSCGGICPKIINNLKKAGGNFANNSRVQFFSYTVTPDIDTLDRLKWYEEQHELQAYNWYLLRGNKSDIYKLARQSYFAEEEMGYTKDSTDFLHTEHVLLIDEHKHIRGVYNGTVALDAERLIEDINILSAE